MWPLCFWLPGTYAAASPPVASMFAILTKVGVYVVLRLWLLLFAPQMRSARQFGGANGCSWRAGNHRLRDDRVPGLAGHGRLASFSVLVSSGTLLASIGMGEASVTSGSNLLSGQFDARPRALFFLVELAERGREPGADMIALTRELYGIEENPAGANEEVEVGVAIPATMALLDIAFICCALVVAGLPPLSGFIAKVGLLKSALDAGGSQGAVPLASWALVAMLLLSGLVSIVALSRAGIRAFWAEPDREQPRVRLIEFGPIAVLLFLCMAQTIAAGPVMRFAEATAQALHAPQSYIRAVLGPAGHGGGS